MPRTENSTLKYNLSVRCDGNEVHNNNYCSLKEIAKHLNFPYCGITDIYEGRRKSMTKYANCKYFPSLTIKLIESDVVVVD
tara:strand:+ start:7014 stop:7256 length:243 start_codon:yes stop_codon:yes gene_type:complete